jgi:hypothetical protein
MDASGTFTDMRQRLLHVAAARNGEVASPLSGKSDKSSEDVRVIEEDVLNTVSGAQAVAFCFVVVPITLLWPARVTPPPCYHH